MTYVIITLAGGALLYMASITAYFLYTIIPYNKREAIYVKQTKEEAE